VLREPASLPDALMRHEFDVFLEQSGRPFV
jgi:hypothetical protein